MPATEREGSRDRDGAISPVRHQHSWSESGRISVPMWDSSDPERAPPPLPLNPTHSPTTKANTSAGIAAAAKQIVERARESQPISSYTSNSNTPTGSPERSLIKGAHHKRLQSIQTGSVKDLRNFLDNRSPERSPERPYSGSGYSAIARTESKEDIHEREVTPTPAPRDPLKDTPSLRPSSRPPLRPLLGENTPPSATMLALQTMASRDEQFGDVTNTPITPTASRSASTYDVTSQLLNLTKIAQNLQNEMSQLSRRSKDNAQDLNSLKDATAKRDEDIRKSLRQLAVSNETTNGLLGPPPVPGEMSRSVSSFANLLDSRPFGSPPSATKSYSVPRAASAHSFMEERIGSPSPYSIEGAASVAMLEKIVREMVTKEGQERLQSSLSELLEKSRKENTQAAKKVEELSEFIKDKSSTQALVHVSRDGPPKLDLNFDAPGTQQKTREAGGKEARMIGDHDEIVKLLDRIKDSVTHTGGTTAEVKTLVRDLRGEILGMGRNLGQKLESITATQLDGALDRSIADGNETKLDAQEVQSIVEESMNELKAHMANIMQQRAEEDDNSFKQLASARSGPDGDEMLAVVRHALAEHTDSIVKREPDTETANLDRDAILEAVKEGLEGFEPDISIQQFGLEREEIIEVLKQGFEEYGNSKTEPTIAAIDKGEVFEAVQEALKDFRAPLPIEQIEQMKEDLLSSVKQTLENFAPPVAAAAIGNDEVTRAAVLEAVKEGLVNHGPAAPREMEISREDLFDAVKASLDGSSIPFGGLGEEVLRQLHELIEGMRAEFQQYIAANGRDTEQVLDAVKDGLESLRAEIESYVDRAQDVTGKDEIVDTVKGGLEQLRADVQGYVAQGPSNASGNADMLQYLRSEFEHLHEVLGARDRDISNADVNPSHTAEVILALKEGMEELKSHVGTSRDIDDDSGPNEETIDAMKEEFEQLKAAVLNANAHDKNELIETIQDSMGALHAKFNGSEMSHMTGGATEDIINEMHAEFSQLKESLHSIIGDADRDAIVSGVKQSIDDLRTQLSGDQSDAAAEALGAIKEELESFKTAMSSSVVLANGEGAASEEGLSSIRASLEEVKESIANRGELGLTDELLEAIQGEFDKVRSTIATSAVHGGSQEEVLDAIRLGLDDLRSHVDKKLDVSPEQQTLHHSEVLDALNDGLESMRADVIKTLDKPLDMTVNYEILDTLKEGLAGLRADLDKIKSADGTVVIPKGGEIVLADGAEVTEARDISSESMEAATPAPAATAPTASVDFSKIELAIAQLQIKVEAMSATIQDLPAFQRSASSASKDDIVALEVMLKEIQDGVASAADRAQPAPREGVAMKEDTDAIETLLRNTKSQLEEMAPADPANVVTKDHIDAVEAVVRITNEAVDSLVEKVESSCAAKADVDVVEVLAQDIKTSLDELKDRIPAPDPDAEKPEPMTKTDLDILGVMITDIKTRVTEMALPDPEELPSKADVEQLHGLIEDFRESHDKMKESYETDIAVTAKAFDDRKQEFEQTVQQLGEFKESLAEMKEELLAKLGEGETGMETLHDTVRGLDEKTGHEPVITEIQGLLEKVTQEFERAHGSIEAIKVDHQQSSETVFEKQAEHKDALVAEIGEKLETYFDGLMSKYDDAQAAAEEKAKSMEEKAAQQVEMLANMKTMTDDLRLSIDTLGATLTSFPETVDKLAEESKTVFNKVDDTYNKLDETQEGVKFEHSVTREEVLKVLSAVGALQSDFTEYNPRFMMTLKEVQAMLSQHYEHSQNASSAAAEQAQAVKELQEQVRGIGTQNEELKSDVSSLPRLMPAPAADAMPVPEKYDDAAVHEKLDKLMGHAEEASKGSTQLERLDQIHEKVMATAAEVSAFVATQAKQITEEHENKEKEAEELALLLERRQAKKEEIEDDITVLNEEKDSLASAVDALKAEKEALAAQKSRLAADVSALETAMQIRRDELHDMDRKAEVLERRILEGAMNQSRMLLLAKSARPAQPKKKPQGRDLRIPSNASAVSAQTVTSSVPAMKANRSLVMRSRPGMQRDGQLSNTAERRIMSLNQINHNVPSGGSALSHVSNMGAPGLKRSHSVKTQYPRKPSWAGKRDLVAPAEENKENETLSEESEDELQRPNSSSEHADDIGSDTQTEVRTSLASGRESYSTYGGGSIADGITPGTDRRISYGTSDLSYGTGSYMTGSEIDRRTSLGSSAGGVVGGGQSVIDEEPSEEEFHEMSEGEDQEHEEANDIVAPLQIEAAPYQDGHGKELYYAVPSDSGLGTDMPTAALSSVNGGEYFKG